jgi:hypothetical protein
MLKLLFRRAASPTRARLTWLAALWACASMAVPLPAQAAEPEPPRPAASPPFDAYQGWREEPLEDWRKANERVGEIGGWRTYLRESQQRGDGPAGGQGQSGHPGH